MNHDLEQLFLSYLDGTITADELTDLESRLLSDDVAVERLSAWCLMNRQIIDILSEDRLHDLIDRVLVGRPGPPGVFDDGPAVHAARGAGIPRSTHGDRLRSGLIYALGLTGIAATFFFLLWTGPWSRTVEPISTVSATRTGGGPIALTDPTVRPVASLTQLIAAKWPSPQAALEEGQVLIAGSHVRLAAGRAKVTFDCGAEVVLAGPCDFELSSNMLSILHSGQLTADVPRRAFGFGVLCPGVDLVDLGTSFGLSVDPASGTELHVFSGEVLCSPNKRKEAGANKIIHVVQDQAKQFSRDGHGEDVDDIAMDRAKFESLLALRRSAADAPPGLASDSLALWLAADRSVVTDSQGRVVNWPDLLNGDNASAEDALQPDPDARPLLAAEAINGLPAVRFDGQSDFLLTTPLETTDDQTVIFVCQFSSAALDESRVWGGQIINYDGPPSRYLSDTLEPGVLQIGEPLLESEFRPTLLTGQVFAGFVGAMTVEAGRVDGAQVGGEKPTLVAYTYNYSRQRSELRIDGQVVGTARAFAPQGITSRKIIGRHAWMELFFGGDLAEMLIYNKALTQAELDSTSRYLADKYAITLNSSADSSKNARQQAP